MGTYTRTTQFCQRFMSRSRVMEDNSGTTTTMVQQLSENTNASVSINNDLTYTSTQSSNELVSFEQSGVGYRETSLSVLSSHETITPYDSTSEDSDDSSEADFEEDFNLYAADDIQLGQDYTNYGPGNMYENNFYNPNPFEAHQLIILLPYPFTPSVIVVFSPFIELPPVLAVTFEPMPYEYRGATYYPNN